MTGSVFGLLVLVFVGNTPWHCWHHLASFISVGDVFEVSQSCTQLLCQNWQLCTGSICAAQCSEKHFNIPAGSVFPISVGVGVLLGRVMRILGLYF